MIGLGSNRLSVCRRGGMSVTQAGRGGMEWLAGGRMPSWASPYSAQATAALKEAYPDLWTTLRDFGFRNPDKVPFINQYPLVAPYLLADGLAFMVDCQYECSAALWKDIVGDRDFVGTGVSLQNGVPYFNGSANYNKSAFLYSFDNTTIEIVYNRDNNSDSIMFLDGSANGQAVGIYQGSYIIGESTYRTMASMATQYGELVTFSTAKDISVENERLAVRSGSNYWTPWGTATIGGRLNNGSFTYQFKGKIYAIRIYNRLLTEQEILANQAIDLQRWQAS